MRKFLGLSVITITVMTLIGCGGNVQPPLYTWGNYVDSSVKYAMHRGDKKALEKHLQELEKIINESESKNQRVAPGIYAEYAQLLYEINKKDKARKYFLLEKQTYPESSTFIDKVMIKLYGSVK